MQVRRVASGQDENGKSRVVSDVVIDSVFVETGYVTELWGADTAPSLPTKGEAPTYDIFFPPKGGYRFLLNQILPDAHQPVDQEEQGNASAPTLSKGAIESLEQGENAGMHISDSVDFIVVLSGTAGIELDDGEKVLLQAGDSFVQNGTRHRWFNPGTVPATFVAVMLGGERSHAKTTDASAVAG